MMALFKSLSEDDANTFRLVLASAGIPFRSVKEADGWTIWIRDGDAKRARSEIEQYLKENPSVQSGQSPSASPYTRTFAGIWVAIPLLALHAGIVAGDKKDFFITTFGASADRILQGELYRSVTALMLHADALHLMTNTVGIAIFVTAVCSVMGWGLGLMTILLTGAAGNLFNALLHAHGHLSVGASTGIFAAVGILCAHRFFKHFRRSGQKLKALIPLGCGLALLGFLGSGAHSDVMAHLFGFLAGMVAGCVDHLVIKRPVSEKYQMYWGLAAAGIVAAAWLKAF